MKVLGRIALALALVALFTGTASALAGDGLYASYDMLFVPGPNGGIVMDVFGDKDLSASNGIQQSEGTSITVASGRLEATPEASKQMEQDLKAANAFTVEAWVKPLDSVQGGPARIVSLSLNPTARDFTLGQQGTQYILRVRTSVHNGGNGYEFRTSENLAKTGWQHVVGTYDGATGVVRIFVDGKKFEQAIGGNLLFEYGDRFLVANELTNDRQWRGGIERVAVYSRALNEAEVQENYSAGREAPALGRVSVSNLWVASGKPYEVVPNGLVKDAKLYIDRDYDYYEIPAYLVGATYIKTANDDKRSTGNNFLAFDVAQDVTVFVAHDPSYADPDWLKSFTRLSDKIEGHNDFDLYRKEFAAGRVSLGGNTVDGKEDYSMYQVFVVPATASTVTTPVPVPPATPAPTVSLNANPASIAQGGSATLGWSGANAASCIASGGWSGTKATSGAEGVMPSATTTYTLACTGAGGSASASVVVTVSTPQPQQVLASTVQQAAVGAGEAGGCTPGETQYCYGGSPETVGKGICRMGRQICDAQGNWGRCLGQVLPTQEVCGNYVDDDCDGLTDNACVTPAVSVGGAQPLGTPASQAPLATAGGFQPFVYEAMGLNAEEGYGDGGSGGAEGDALAFDEEDEPQGNLMKVRVPGHFVPLDQEITVPVTIRASKVFGFQLTLAYDKELLDVAVEEGELLKRGGANTFFTAGDALSEPGKIKGVAAVRIDKYAVDAFDDIGVLLKVKGKKAGQTRIDLEDVILSDQFATEIQAEVRGAPVYVGMEPLAGAGDDVWAPFVYAAGTDSKEFTDTVKAAMGSEATDFFKLFGEILAAMAMERAELLSTFLREKTDLNEDEKVDLLDLVLSAGQLA